MQSQGLAAVMILAVLFVGTAFVVLIAFECGLRLGRWRSTQPDPEPQLPARMLIASVLSLLAFVLGFTFGIAASHFDSRNQALDNEAVAISTAYHRADLLPEPERSNIRKLLGQYLDLRVQGVRFSDMDRMVARIRGVQEQLWSQALDIQKKDTAQPPVTILLQSLNDVIDVSAERVLRNMTARIPTGIWFVLYAIAILAVAAAGYLFGLAGARRSISAVAYALVFAGVITMIVDVDKPQFGHFEESKQALIDLRTRLNVLNTSQK
jgi:uncharacterized membrane protein (DUF485 family)